MTTLAITDQNFTINVRYTGDFSGSDGALFTVMDVEGLSAAERALGFTYRRGLVYNINTLKTFVNSMGLKMTLTTQKPGFTPVVLVPHSGQYANSGLGFDNI